MSLRQSGKDGMREPITTSRRRGGYKRPFDLALLTLAHITLSPVLLVLWGIIPLAIWISDRGPVFYAQKRVGRNGRVFSILKFRTMIPEAESQGPAWTAEGDPRITPLGKILRRSAMDELPGVFSIWKGDMSLVGPRALDVSEQADLESEIPGFESRLQITPGLTGLAQIYDKEDHAQNKLDYDLKYAECMNPLLDAKLLFYSVCKTLSGGWDNRRGKPSSAQFSDNSNDADSSQ